MSTPAPGYRRHVIAVTVDVHESMPETNDAALLAEI